MHNKEHATAVDGVVYVRGVPGGELAGTKDAFAVLLKGSNSRNVEQ
jgi:hypothetical protein